MIARVLTLLALCHNGGVLAHDGMAVNNAAHGVPGFPDCIRANPNSKLSVHDAAHDLICAQKAAPEGSIKIGCVGDSITAGVHSSDASHTYPSQLQGMLDDTHGQGKYSVTNLGACGSTMLKKGNSPYWKRPQYAALTKGKWDIIIIMLGTNDAKDPGSHGPNNWQHDCGGPNHTTTLGCSFADDFKSMIDLVRTLGTAPSGPKIYVQIPPPLMQQGAYGMNQTVINSVYPELIPMIQKTNHVPALIDVYSGMGGVPDWETKTPSQCKVDSAWAPCAWYCDKQSCDQCHPNDNGYNHMASIVLKGLGLDKTGNWTIVV